MSPQTDTQFHALITQRMELTGFVVMRAGARTDFHYCYLELQLRLDLTPVMENVHLQSKIQEKLQFNTWMIIKTSVSQVNIAIELIHQQSLIVLPLQNANRERLLCRCHELPF